MPVTLPRRRFLKNVTTLLAAGASVPAMAQPGTRPVRVLVGYPPGGATDVIARLIAQRCTHARPADEYDDLRARER